MPFLFEIAVGGVVFSFLSSLAAAAREAQKPKSHYDRWLAEIQKTSIVKDQS